LARAQSSNSEWLPGEIAWLSAQIRPFVHMHIASFLCMIIGSFLSLLTPLVLKWLIDYVIPQRQIGLLLLAVGLIFLSYQGKTILASAGSYLMLSAAQNMGLRLRVRLLRHLDTLSADHYETTAVGSVLYPFQEPIDEISYFGSDLLPAILRAILTTGSTIATMLLLSPALTIAILPLIPAFLVSRQHFRRRLMDDSDSVQADRLASSAFLEEHLSSVIAIQLLGQSKRQERRAFQLFARSTRSQQKLFRSGVWFTVATSMAVAVSMSTAIGYGGWKVLAGGLSVGGLVAFYSFVMQLFEPLSGAAELYARAQKVFASIRQVQATLSLLPTVTSSPLAIRLSKEYRPTIAFDGVEFGYVRRKSTLTIPALRIEAGEQLVIVGENGAGKSTLAKLMARLYDVHRGSIYIGGKDIRDIEVESLRRYVCYVPRDPVLFNGTLATNLRFVRPAASDRELNDAVQAVGLSDLIATLPEGLHQRIGPDACQLSGGQRQRLAIARALLQQPRILILDEATSCLDPTSEGMLLRAIRRVLCSATLIVVSHRLSTSATFERVLVLCEGRLCEDGDPAALHIAPSVYATLFHSTPSHTNSESAGIKTGLF
jgi:ABC-type multidrug transport system fused ATPase/permease subunit